MKCFSSWTTYYWVFSDGFHIFFVLFSTCTNPIIHFYPQKFCIGIVFDFHVPREIENNDCAKFWGVKEVHYGICESRELLMMFTDVIKSTLHSYLTSKSNREYRGSSLNQFSQWKSYGKDKMDNYCVIFTHFRYCTIGESWHEDCPRFLINNST